MNPENFQRTANSGSLLGQREIYPNTLPMITFKDEYLELPLMREAQRQLANPPSMRMEKQNIMLKNL